MIYISRHHDNVTTTVPVNTGQRVLLMVILSTAGYLLCRFSTATHPWAWGRIIIGVLMIILAAIVLFASVVNARRTPK